MLKTIRRWLASDEAIENGPCNKYGHDWNHMGVSGYYTKGVPYFNFGKSFKVEREDRYKCRKCGQADFRKKKVGKIRVDKDTDELTVVQ